MKVETRVENGDARDVICQVAEKMAPDALVMGSHGYGLIKRSLRQYISFFATLKGSFCQNSMSVLMLSCFENWQGSPGKC